jgi:hypothetical protein
MSSSSSNRERSKSHRRSNDNYQNLDADTGSMSNTTAIEEEHINENKIEEDEGTVTQFPLEEALEEVEGKTVILLIFKVIKELDPDALNSFKVLIKYMFMLTQTK